MATDAEIADTEGANDTDSKKAANSGSMTVSSCLSLFIFVIAMIALA